MKRVFIITGSRYFEDEKLIYSVLSGVYDGMDDDETVVFLHGACPTGADAIADRILREWAVYDDLLFIKPIPADWDNLGKAAGPIRNGVIVDEAINDFAESIDEIQTLAFVKGSYAKSKGTKDMVTKSLAAGIDTNVYFQKEGK